MECYQAALNSLKSKELVYPCTCTRKDIELAASAPHAEHELPPYPGTCAGRTVADARTITDKPYAWRFRASQHVLFYEDAFAGPQQLNATYGGDFVAWKNNDTPAYQLAVVVDDADMGITEVIRGDDLIPSTPRQIQLYQALGLKLPRFYHIPLVIGSDGRRLAKRHGDARLATYREQGLPPAALLGLLAFSLGMQNHCEPIALHSLLEKFQIESIPKSPFVITHDLLHRLNQTHSP
jgi:glutamyl-tRNA synthetase